MNSRYLTKSRFKLGLECPAKLFYTSKKDIYYDNRVENQFLAALAEGGFQVGELAKLYYPGGVEIEELDYATALAKTNTLLTENEVVIYEAAFCYGNLFIRADILSKKGSDIELIEVKAKSYDGDGDPFVGKKGSMSAKWKPYLWDVAFQKYVINKAFPEFNVRANLMLTNKQKQATVDGMNQLFMIKETEGRYKTIRRVEVSLKDLGEPILTVINVDDIIDRIYAESSPPFEVLVKEFADKYAADEKINPMIGSQCSNCEFNPDAATIAAGYRSGFNECWMQAGLSAEALQQPLITNLWNSRKKDELIKAGKYLLSQISREDLEPKTKKKEEPVAWLKPIDRQMLQIDKAAQQNADHYIDVLGLRAEMEQWKFPLHFIDFETTAVAIPFNAGRRPYEQIAFQFSHHIIQENGSVEHCDEWISEATGVFPNFEFVRALKAYLQKDDGTIFRYAAHENTILNVIYRQLVESDEPDKEILCHWIKTITKSSSSFAEKWEGERNMVDLLQLVLRYYYNPLMKGSNSIKQVLPAILHTSEFLKQKYNEPVYGAAIRSKNFQNHKWILDDGMGGILNPYKLLPPIHIGIENDLLDEMVTDEEAGIMDGGAAMMAYAKMQFTEMSTSERTRVKEALLRYCELDTLAMVMIYEAWREWCK